MDDKAKNVVILGSTGSIGQQTLEVIRAMSPAFRITGLAAGRNIQLLNEQIKEFKPEMVYSQAKLDPEDNSKFFSMEQMACESDADIVVVATSGKAGLSPTLAALKAGKTVALASKEVLIMAGALIMEEAERYHARLNPIDSEHSAIWQCLRGEESKPRKVFLTASGGPFYHYSNAQLGTVTVKEALQHPVWNMGTKISIDSATLMNKGLEAIEAHYLFNVPFENIKPLYHPQCIVHSMVEFNDGSIKAQMGFPDMRMPIQHALSYPQRLPNPTIQPFDFRELSPLTFEPINTDKFPCLKLALEAGARGGTYPTVLCAADEVAVEFFLSGQIRFIDIPTLIEETLQRHQVINNPGIDDIIQVDSWARDYVQQLCLHRSTKYFQKDRLSSVE